MDYNNHNKNIYRQIQRRYGIVGDSKPIQEALQKLIQAAPTDLSVLITGETGTGKEVFAKACHGLSHRKKNPFLSVNCGAIPDNLIESELFGHEKGAFTGAMEQRKGFFESAAGGTILLDEIGELPIATQVKLLRVLESGEFSRLGSSKVHKVDVRVLAATNRDIKKEVEEGNFRQDLYFRLKNVEIFLPPLREHSEDIPELFEYFAEKVSNKLDINFEGISPDAMSILKSMPWPGNIRELRNLTDTMITLEQGNYITPETLKSYVPAALPPRSTEAMGKERSLVSVPKEEEGFEIGLIFRTLLELKAEVSDIKDMLRTTMHSVTEIKDYMRDINVETVEAEPYEEILDDDEIESLADMEKNMIATALQKYEGNRRQAAKVLGISERTLYRKISEYRI
jgi:DNA-binding NtrC family response regulator